MGGLSRRVQKIEAQLPAPPGQRERSALPPDERAYLEQLEAVASHIVMETPEAFRPRVIDEINRMGRTPMTYPQARPAENSWLVDGTLSVLSYEILMMAYGVVEGWYTGPQRFPEVVCDDLSHRSKLKFMWHPECACPACGFYWFTRWLRERLMICPLCNTPLPPLVMAHARSTLLGNRKWITFMGNQVEEERRRVGSEAIERLGIHEARRWLLEDVDLPEHVVEAIFEAAQDGGAVPRGHDSRVARILGGNHV